MDETCAFSDPKVVSEVIAISDKLKKPLEAHKAKVQRVVWALLLGLSAFVLVQKQLGMSSTIPGWKGVAVMLALPLPVVGLVLWQRLGDKQIRRRVYQEEGLCCLNCGRVPTDSGSDDCADWVVCRCCPHCEGQLKRFAVQDQKA